MRGVCSSLPTFTRAELPEFSRAEQIMGMPAQLERSWTVAEVREELLSDNPWPRYELLGGELIVTPSPTYPHYRLARWLDYTLRDYLQREPVGEVMLSLPSDLELLPGTISQPDLFVPPMAEVGAAQKWSDFRHLLLAVEVLSPRTARYDRGAKRRHYQAAGVREYWIVDADARLIERWRPEDERPEIIRDHLTWHPEGASVPLEFALPELFAAAPPE
ncbi:hypothetical protein BH23GEM2_BH23GEM2_12620 [soil metagenome]